MSFKTFLLTIYKSFLRPDLNYCDVVYNQPSNNAFSTKFETVPYNSASAITGAVIRVCKKMMDEKMDEKPLPILQNCFN